MSSVYPKSLPHNRPMWIIRAEKEGMSTIGVYDAVTGEFYGLGVPPPSYNGYSLTGQIPRQGDNDPCYSTCTGCSVWDEWYDSAHYWFENYFPYEFPTTKLEVPTENDMDNYISDESTAMFYEIAHGNSIYFLNRCGIDLTTSDEIDSWMSSRNKMLFSFIASCDGMCSTGSGMLSHALRKGSSEYTYTVGYCGMSHDDCVDCWDVSLDWQEQFFENAYSDSFHGAYVDAMATYGDCVIEGTDCILEAGDLNLSLLQDEYMFVWWEETTEEQESEYSAAKLIDFADYGNTHTITETADVTFTSGERILMNPGFHVKKGAKFKATIESP